MGYSATAFDALRRDLIGTSTVPSTWQSPVPAEWGPTSKRFLKKLQQHPSKASATYYYRNHLQYFDSIFRSMLELARVLEKGGLCVLVVQDSYYKDLRNDLAQSLSEMGSKVGFTLFQREDFTHRQTIAGINPAVRKYRKTFFATESVLAFSKG
jgi:hypothetical protein